MEANEQIVSVLVILLFYLDATATYWSLSITERFNVTAIYMEQNRLARWVFRRFGIKVGYLIWITFIMTALTAFIYYCAVNHVAELIWALFAMGLIIAQLHAFNFIHIRNNDKYQQLLKELRIRQVSV